MLPKLRILLVSDLHLNSKNIAKLVQNTPEKFDLVIIPGDFLNLNEAQSLGKLNRQRRAKRVLAAGKEAD